MVISRFMSPIPFLLRPNVRISLVDSYERTAQREGTAKLRK